MIRRSHHLLDRFISSRIIYNMLDEQSLMEYLNQDDPTLKAAIEVFKRNEAFPKKPKKEATHASGKNKQNGR